MKIINKSLVLINKRINLNFSNFTMPISIFTKYPVFLTALFNRIDLIKTQYSIKFNEPLSPCAPRVFNLRRKLMLKKSLKIKEVYIFFGVKTMVCFTRFSSSFFY
jgi:hypothetical protein